MTAPRDGTSRRLGQPTARNTLNATDTDQAKVTPSLADPVDSVARDVGDLLQTWLGIKLDEVDDLVAEARDKVDAIPSWKTIGQLVGELVISQHALEADVARLRGEVARLTQRRRVA